MNLDLRTLQLFVAVVEEQTVAKAAKREHIAASAVSKRIADLEREVKVDLFRRHRTGLEPTPAGHALLHHARMLMRNLAQLETELGDYEQGLRGSVRIFANVSALVQYLPDDLSRFLTQHPLVRVDLEEAISPLIVRARSYRPSLKLVAVPLDEPWATRHLDICVLDMVSLPPASRLLVEHLTRR